MWVMWLNKTAVDLLTTNLIYTPLTSFESELVDPPHSPSADPQRIRYQKALLGSESIRNQHASSRL